MSEGPTRLTVRGGRDQFDWNNVKDDKHYQNYLGHSLKAPVGRWQHNKDLEWFNKAGESEESKNSARLEELRVLKQAEEEALAAAMGITLPPREQRQGHAEVPSKTDEKSDDAQEQRSRRRQARRSESPQAELRYRPRSHSRSRTHRHGHRHSERSTRTRDREGRQRSRSRSRERHTRRRHRSNSRDISNRDTYRRSHHSRRDHSRERDPRDGRDKRGDR